ncbi:hypothetical protein GCM10020258_21740 [Sphingomonas yabuuchiae]
MSDFVAGFSARQNAAAAALQQAFAPPGGFAPSGMPGVNIDLGSGPISFRPQAPTGGLGATSADNVAPGQPRHFHPASRDHDPTQGWDPFAACEDVAEPAIDPLAAAHASGHAEGYAEGWPPPSASSRRRPRPRRATATWSLPSPKRCRRASIARPWPNSCARPC